MVAVRKISFVSRVLALGLVAVGLSACMELREVDKADRATPVVKTKAQSASGPAIEPEDEIGRYRVIFPDSVGGWLRRTSSNGESQMVATQVLADGRRADVHVQADQKLVYEWGTVNDSGWSAKGRVDVQIPADIVIEGIWTPAHADFSKLKAGPLGRLVFRDQAILRTEGLDLELRAVEVHVGQNAIFESFAEAAEAAPGRPGRSGGRLVFSAGRLIGNLSIFLRGEHGGRGLAGAEPTDAMKGRAGLAGRPAHFEVSRGGCDAGRCGTVIRCSAQPPGDGTAGGPGFTGAPGGNGGRGGDSAQLIFQIDDETAGHAIVTVQPGRAGIGGLGGLGGAGGAGGPAGKHSTGEPLLFGDRNSCEPARAGEDGPRGASGPSGLPGQDGQPGAVCRVGVDGKMSCER